MTYKTNFASNVIAHTFAKEGMCDLVCVTFLLPPAIKGLGKIVSLFIKKNPLVLLAKLVYGLGTQTIPLLQFSKKNCSKALTIDLILQT